MLNMEEVNNTVEELENSPTTFETCIKLAALYTIQDHLKTQDSEVATPDEVVEELNDILPQYNTYCRVKKDFQLGRSNEDTVLKELKFVCREFEEFIETLYSNTNFAQERQLIIEALKDLSNRYLNDSGMGV